MWDADDDEGGGESGSEECGCCRGAGVEMRWHDCWDSRENVGKGGEAV